MEYRKLGKTGIRVSKISYGASSLGGVFHPINKKEGIHTVHAAIDHGINLIDCSPYYGDLVAEKTLGLALKDIPRDKYFLSTKVGRYWKGPAKIWDYGAKKIVNSVEQSLHNMHVDYVDFIHCHDIEFADKEQIIYESLPALHQLKESGKVRYVGLTGLPLDNFIYIIDRVQPGIVEVILSFCHYSLNDDSLMDLINYMKINKVGIINASPLSMGLLTRRGVPDWHPAGSDIVNTCKKAADYCEKQGEKIEKLAIQFATQHPDIPTTLVGTANPETIVQNIKWAEEPMNKILLNEVLNILKPIHRKTWKNS